MFDFLELPQLKKTLFKNICLNFSLKVKDGPSLTYHQLLSYCLDATLHKAEATVAADDTRLPAAWVI